ncbi:MAG TPA: hypothetical protein VK601_06465 [Kofleriaceae bacterium]|nr:hypothetical protein [Kofleriaceae bacterium]
MKPILLIAFLALGPALADQFPAFPPGFAPEAVAVLSQRPGAVPPAARLDDARTLLCGREP